MMQTNLNYMVLGSSRGKTIALFQRKHVPKSHGIVHKNIKASFFSGGDTELARSCKFYNIEHKEMAPGPEEEELIMKTLHVPRLDNKQIHKYLSFSHYSKCSLINYYTSYGPMNFITRFYNSFIKV